MSTAARAEAAPGKTGQATVAEQTPLGGPTGRSDRGELAAVLDAVSDGVFLLDPVTLRFVHANAGATAQVGYTRDELLRMTPLDLQPLYDERGYRALLEPLLDGRLPSRTVGTLHRRRDGSLIPVEVSLRYAGRDVGTGRIVCVARDVTEHAAAEARLGRLTQAERARAAEFAAMTDALGDGVVVCDPDGGIRRANPAARALLGDRLECWDQVRVSLDDPDACAPAPGAPDPQGPVELQLRTRPGQWLSLASYPVTADAGFGPGLAPVTATIFLIRDVTEARATRRAREAFIGVLSHELRTPVTTIYAGSKVLGGARGSLAPAVRQEVYRDIAAESDRLYRLVEDLLVLARFESITPGSLASEPVLLQRVLPELVEAERTRFAGTRFVVQTPAGLPPVRAERASVEQAARNLLANAARHGPPGGTVLLTIAEVGDRVEVRVLDEGPGFPVDEADRIFDLVDRSVTASRMNGGAGIGLFVCRRLVEAMGGHAWARPRPGGGSEFGFDLTVFNEEEA